MSKEDVVKYLSKVKRPVDMRELLVAIPYNRATISSNCRRLRKSGEIKYRIEKVKPRSKYVYYL